MKLNQLKLAIFVVWIIVSAAIFCTLIVPLLFSRDSINAFVPECDWKAKYNKECPLCGLTTSFFHISEGRFRQAHLSNAFGIYLYLIFMLNEIVVMVTSIKKLQSAELGWKETLFTVKRMLTRKEKETFHAST